MFVEIYSIWQKGQTGEVQGGRVEELRETDWLSYCDDIGVNPEVEATEVLSAIVYHEENHEDRHGSAAQFARDMLAFLNS